MRRHSTRRGPRWPMQRWLLPACLIIQPFCGLSAAQAAGLTTKSPEVVQAIERGIQCLEASALSDDRVGAVALAGLAIVKHTGMADDPTVLKCVSYIQSKLGNRDPAKLELDNPGYSAGLAILFLCETEPIKYRADIECLLKYLRRIQKPHGGWGYPERETGDTSMTQYGVLGSWAAVQAGFEVPPESIEKVTLWLLKTQDPSGGFGYQGKISANFPQLEKQADVKNSLSAAGLGSLYVCAQLLGLTPARVEKKDSNLPPALKELKPKENTPEGARMKTHLDPTLVREAHARGNQWFAANFKVDAGLYNHYYLYALERYKSFQEYFEKSTERDPQWYSDCARYLVDKQNKDGSWMGDCGKIPDTAFSVLFLMRSMRKSLEKARDFGEGLLVARRGLPKDTSAIELRDGQVVSRALLGPAEKLLAALEDPEKQDLNDSVEILAELPADKVQELSNKYGEQIRRLVGHKSPDARLAAVKALGKTRDLDNVEPLLYALTDPEPAVVLAAHEALLRIRRAPSAIHLPANFSEEDRRLVIEKWKAWYRAVRPNANLE